MTATPNTSISTERLLRFCPEGKTYQTVEDAVCNWDHDGKKYRHRIRRMRVCLNCEQAYLTQADFHQHECFDLT